MLFLRVDCYMANFHSELFPDSEDTAVNLVLDGTDKCKMNEWDLDEVNILHVLKLCLYAHRVTTLEIEAKHYLNRFI